MSDFATFAGQRVISLSLTWPAWGLWAADVSLASSSPIPSTAAPLTIGPLTLIGSAFRAASFAGSRSARIVGGYGGWGDPVPSQAYRGSNVRISTVLRDVATLVGEKVSVDIPDANLGGFVREAARASRVLRQVAGSSWWIAPDGVTHVGPRTDGQITSDFQVIGWSGKEGSFTIATEAVDDWSPGRAFTAPTVTGTQVVGYTQIDMNNDGRLRIKVLSTGS